MDSNSTAAREHIEEIRRTKFSIGVKPNPSTVDLHQPDENLSAELQAKGLHVVNELIANSEDNKYPEGVDPSLEFVITSTDITDTGAPATLLVFNNDNGFSEKKIDSICEVGCIGEKGIGFRSVFLITTQPYIFSNGYQIRLTEKPCQQSNSSYIVPEWVKKDPILSAIQTVYGSTTPLPTTTLVLPLKPEKVNVVKDQLSSVHPEFLLFLSNITRLSIREDNKDPRLNTVSPISIRKEKVPNAWKSKDPVSYTVHLSTADKVDTRCGYYMWKQSFPVKQENRDDVKMEVKDWVITLAFPCEQRSIRGIYSCLPTKTVTNFPFIIQSDFLMDPSRENILWDNKWNQGILDCIPDTFLNAFTALVKSTPNAPVSSLRNMFRFLPVNKSSHPKLNDVRDAIKSKLKNESIFPCELYTGQKLFCRPIEVGWVKPAFWSIMNRARNQGLNFSSISSHGAYIFAPSFDKKEYNDFLEIRPVDCEWYAKCIKSSNLVMGVSEDVYIRLLVFIAECWGSWSDKTSIKNTPLMKYVERDGNVDVVTLVSGLDKLKLLAADSDCISWLINWNQEFRCLEGRAFLPMVTQEAIRSCMKKPMLVKWLKDVVDVKFVSVYKYAESLSISVKWYPKLVVTYAGFLYTSFINDYLSKYKVEDLCSKMPILDNYGQVPIRRGAALLPSSSSDCISRYTEDVRNSRSNMRFYEKHKRIATSDYVRYIRMNMNSAVVIAKGEILIPADGSRWVELFGTDPRRLGNYAELAKAYTRQVSYFGGVISGEEIVKFLGTYVGVSDVPHLSPPNGPIPTLSAPLTKSNTYLLLDWIRNLKTSDVSLPQRFLASIKYNSWLKISWSSSPDYCPPSESFMLESSIANFLKDESPPFDIPLVDEKFYGEKIKNYKEELETIGVRTRHTEACEYIGKRLTSLAESLKVTRYHVLWIQKFLEFLRKNCISPENFIERIGGDNWLRTYEGIAKLDIKFPDESKKYLRLKKWKHTRPDAYRSPYECISFYRDWEPKSLNSVLPYIDDYKDFHDSWIHNYGEELMELGVVTDSKYGCMIPSRKRKRENEEKA